jgi:hypothetical protein
MNKGMANTNRIGKSIIRIIITHPFVPSFSIPLSYHISPKNATKTYQKKPEMA